MGAIGLNPIRLDRIGLDPIRINAIKLGVPGASGTDRPYIDPEVLASLKAVCICYGKSNDDPDRAVVKNLVDPDNPFVISNAAYTEGSGYADKGSPYYGAFVTDGIDDLITSTKTVQEMLGGSNEITVVSMIHQIGLIQVYGLALTNYIRNNGGYLRSAVNSVGKTGIYGYTANNLNQSIKDRVKVINTILGDKKDYTASISDSYVLDDSLFHVQNYVHDGIIAGDGSQLAWYWTIIANKVLTTDQINQVIAYFNLDRTLNPDILCNTIKQGITNENHAEFGDKLIDYSGNGRDIQLNNIAWKGDSGIGKYNFSNINIISSNRFEGAVTTNKCHFTKKLTNTTNNFCDLVVISPNEPIKFKVSGLSDGRKLFIANKSGSGSNYNFDNGEHEVSLSFSEGVGQNNPFGVTGDIGDIDVTVEFIPSHAGALCLDGVNDFGKVTGMPIYKDYTVIADYERFYLEPITGGRASILSKSSKVGDGSFIFNLEDQDGGKACYTFGEANGNISDDITRIIRYQSKYYNTKTLSIGTAEDNDFMVLGKVREVDSRYFCGAIYSLMTFPYSMSEFLIERQLKKHKLGTLYPDMVEFRPIVKSNNKWDIIEIWQGDKSLYRPTVNDDKTGIYLKKDSTIGIYVKPYVGQKVSEIVYNGVSYTDLKLNSNGFYYKVVPITKSPQKIGITIEQDENYVLFNPVINSNYDNYKLTFHLRDEKLINIGDYIPKGTYIRANLYLKNNIDELVTFTFNGVNIDYAKSPVLDTAYNIRQIYNYDSPQEVNITIDEYIRYEDIVQPYPVIFQITDRNTNQRYSWGDKIKVGSSIRLSQGEKPNLLSGLYSIKSYEYEGETYSYNQLTNLNIILTKQSISLSCNKTWLLDDNEPKCILSPRLLSIPNSSYKILGYIPDISGHGNNGVIHNSAYAEGSGVNEDGSYQFDGVDDHITIPTLSSGGKQVLMKVNSRKSDCYLYDQRNNWTQYLGIVSTKDFIAYNYSNQRGKTYIDGILNENITANDLISITHNITVTNNRDDVEQYSPCIGTSFAKNSFSKMSLYDFMLFDNISTDDKIKELNEYVGIQGNVWRILTQLSNSTLISNETLIKNE
nr:MAG TPA: hypothetical protein [Caudoviricetes sp.]